MARKFPFVDGFDCYTTPVPFKWDNNWGYYGSGSWGWSPCTISLTGGRGGYGGKLVTNGFAFGHANTGGVERWRGFENKDVWVVGVAMKATMEAGNGSVLWLKGDGEPQIFLKFCINGYIEVWCMRYNRTTGYYEEELLGQSNPGVFINNAWNYYEMKADIPNSTLQVRLNGNTSPIINLSSISPVGYNYTPGAENYPAKPFPDHYNSLVIGNNKWSMAGLGVGTQEYDDLYVDYDTDAAFRGDVKIFGFLPTANGFYAEWNPSAGSNYQCVDDADPNGDTDFVSEGTPNKRDTYTHDSLPTMPDGATIHAVAVSICAKKQSPGIAEVAPMIRSNTTDSVGDTVTPVAETYLYYTSFWEQDPATVAAWDVSGVNAVQGGQKVIT